METVIRLDGITKYYGKQLGVADLDLEVQAGEIFGYLGPNGAGKTTTIRMLLDLIRPSSGKATVLGLDAQADSLKVRRSCSVSRCWREAALSASMISSPGCCESLYVAVRARRSPLFRPHRQFATFEA